MESTISKIKDNETYWNQRAKGFNESINGIDRKRRIENIIKALIDRGMLNSNSIVLDIGCGPGHISSELGKFAKRVVGIDISENMLDYARENCKLQDNIEFHKLAWNEIDLKDYHFENKFDLVIANMCPGISIEEDIQKMMLASSKYCYISGFVYRSNDVYEELLEELNINNKDKSKISMYNKLSYIWNNDMYPEIEYEDSKWENTYSLEQAIEQYIFEINSRNNELSQEQIEKLESTLKEKCEDDKIVEKTKSKIARVFWEVR